MARKDELYVGEPVDERRNALEGKYGISVSADNRDVVRMGKLVVLSIKPQSLKVFLILLFLMTSILGLFYILLFTPFKSPISK